LTEPAATADASVDATSGVAADVDAGTGWHYSVSVRSLCEFTAKRGDLDRRFTPSATALEGLQGQASVASRRGPAYETELALHGQVGALRIRGRADGYDPVRLCLEEVKTIRGTPEDVPENRRQLHWAQLQTYGALFCRSRHVEQIHLALVYVDAATQGETVLRQLCSAAELDTALVERCQQFSAWAQQEAAHRTARDAGLAQLPFPPGAFRPGQRLLAETVYRAASAGRCLLAQAPTGIGKTIGTLYPMLRAVPVQRLDKVAYLTCKGTGRQTALQALQRLREHTPGRALRVLALVARDQACEHPGKACHGDACPLAQGFYDRLPAARSAAVADGWLDPAALRRHALAHQVCPYYLGQELLRWADVVVGDVHHAFDAHGQLHGLAQAQDWRIGLLVDEAHNLIERARQMYSTTLSLAGLRAALQAAPATLRPRVGRLLRVANELVAEQATPYAAHDRVPEALADAVAALVSALADHLQQHPLATGAMLALHFDLLRFQRLGDELGNHSLFDISVAGGPDAGAGAGTGIGAGQAIAPPPDATLCIRCIVPAGFLRPRFAACHSSTLFSATLGPPAYQQDLLGLPENTGWLDVAPVFDAAHLRVQVADGVSTRWPDRAGSLDAVVAVLRGQFEAQPGNYLAFFSSFDYLAQVADRLHARAPGVPQWRQARSMDEAARQAFLARFTDGGRGIGFAVLGGAFSEGVDLPGQRLIGAFIATLALPPVSPLQAQIRARLDQRFGPGHGYADLVPGLQKVVQAAGRILRTPDDQGWLWLIDDRYRRPAVQALLPPWWRIAPAPAGEAQRTV